MHGNLPQQGDESADGIINCWGINISCNSYYCVTTLALDKIKMLLNVSEYEII